MTPVMERVDTQDNLDLLAQKVMPLLAHQVLRGHQVHQEEVMMGSLDHQGLPDLLEHPYLELTEAHRPSIFPDHLVPQVHLDYLDIPQG